MNHFLINGTGDGIDMDTMSKTIDDLIENEKYKEASERRRKEMITQWMESSRSHGIK